MGPEWMARAACAGANGEDFFPVGKGGPADEQAAYVKARYCGRCPVRGECLNYALDRGLSDGIFGGLTDVERARVKRRQQRSRPQGEPARPNLIPATEAGLVIARSRLTDKDIAARTGVHADTVSKIRRGKTTWVDPRTLDRLVAGVGA